MTALGLDGLPLAQFATLIGAVGAGVLLVVGVDALQPRGAEKSPAEPDRSRRLVPWVAHGLLYVLLFLSAPVVFYPDEASLVALIGWLLFAVATVVSALIAFEPLTDWLRRLRPHGSRIIAGAFLGTVAHLAGGASSATWEILASATLSLSYFMLSVVDAGVFVIAEEATIGIGDFR